MFCKLATVVTVALHCGTISAQWSSFKPVTIDLLPQDQRGISEQTVSKGKVVPKEIRVDWYGFTLKNRTNVIEDRYQYPVSDPTIAPGDKIIRIHFTDVKDADSVEAALRASPERSPASMSVERVVEGQAKTIRVSLYRAESLTLKDIFDRRISIRPPPLNSGDVGMWGGVRSLSFRLTAIAENGEGIFAGAIDGFTKKGIAKVENVVLRGWNVAGLKVGESARLSLPRQDEKHKVLPEVERLVLGTGSSGIPRQKTAEGRGFLVKPSTQIEEQSCSPAYIIGIGDNEKLKVDGKDLEVHVLINME